MNNFVYFILLLSGVGEILCLKLLLVFPVPTKSHYTLGCELGKGLAKIGHEVTMISAYLEPKPPNNYKEIVLSQLADELKNDVEMKKKFNMFEMENVPAISQLFVLHSAGELMGERFFKDSRIQALLKSNEHYDAVIVEQCWNDAMKIFAYHFKAPLILYNSMGPNRWVNNLVANPEPPSYVPDALLSFTGNMNMFERLYNFVFGFLENIHLYWLFYPNQNALLKKYYPNGPELNDIQYNVSLVLLNSHESVNQPVPHVPNMIDIGGHHVNPPKELPKELKDFMDNAKDGVIYFSMGSNLVPSLIPNEKKDALLKVLGARKEKVLWKWDEETLENKPDNMMISKWFPQQAILAHPNCKLFITHGGLLSTIETVYLGVPVLFIPIFGDQKLNAARAASLGYGRSIYFSKINEHDLSNNVNELLTNPSYRENVNIRSKLMHDRPIKPIDLANYWIEYVVRHKGAPHLRVAGVNLSFNEYYMLDVMAVILGIMTTIIYMLKKLCRCRKVAPKKTTIKKKRE